MLKQQQKESIKCSVRNKESLQIEILVKYENGFRFSATCKEYTLQLDTVSIVLRIDTKCGSSVFWGFDFSVHWCPYCGVLQRTRCSIRIYDYRIGPLHRKQSIRYSSIERSARRNQLAWLKRHGNKKKSIRWHIDYLSSKARRMLGAITIPGPRKHECELAKQLSKMFEVYVCGFGISDCHCSWHLFYASEAAWE